MPGTRHTDATRRYRARKAGIAKKLATPPLGRRVALQPSCRVRCADRLDVLCPLLTLRTNLNLERQRLIDRGPSGEPRKRFDVDEYFIAALHWRDETKAAL